jgi:hypothetical protein
MNESELSWDVISFHYILQQQCEQATVEQRLLRNSCVDIVFPGTREHAITEELFSVRPVPGLRNED